MNWSLPSPVRYEEIRAAVADLIEDWGIAAYPFSIWSLLKKMGIRTISYSSLPRCLAKEMRLYWPDALTIYPPDFNPAKTIIFYNDKQDREHIRFTLAHELAHLVLTHSGTDEEIYEHEADIFANYFLAPAPLVLRDSELHIKSISYDFQVSHECAKSVMDRARKRASYGPRAKTEYELRILASCFLKGDGCLALV